MKVMIDDKQVQNIEPIFKEVNRWWTASIEEIFRQQRLVYCVHIDGNMMYHDYEQYIVNHMDSINEINIQTLSRMESIQETEKSLVEYIERFIPASLEMANHFFGVLSEEHWGQFSDFIQGLNWIIQAIEFEIQLFKQDGISVPDYLFIIDKLNPYLLEMEGNLERQEYSTVGDLIQYEIVPVLQEFLSRQKEQGAEYETAKN